MSSAAVTFEHCDNHQQAVLDGPRGKTLRCSTCSDLIVDVDVSGVKPWIESQVARKQRLVEQGKLHSRKQATKRGDAAIDRDGLSAEAAACAILCPSAFSRWQRSAGQTQGNRGRDLLRSWTGLDKPIEVKHTRYHDSQRGFLLIRPPRRTPGKMRAEYIDDAYYVLMSGEPFRHTLLGWIDRDRLIEQGQPNPVPVGSGQRETWGIHWSKLLAIEELAQRVDIRRNCSWRVVVTEFFAGLLNG